MWSLVNDILHIDDSAACVPYPIAYEIAVLFKLPELCGYPVHAVLAYLRKSPCGVVPIIREGKHRGKKSTCLIG